MLNAHVDETPWSWRSIGRLFGDVFKDSRNVTVATTAVGAIPFYSSLPAIDMHGLTDRWVAHHGVSTPGNVGHRRAATLGYLILREVNIVLGHPWIVPNRKTRPTESSTWLPRDAKSFVQFAPGDVLPPQALIVEIPLDPDWALAFLYLTRHPAIDAAIATRGWIAFGGGGSGLHTSHFPDTAL
jgi:hypothetical protein